MNPPVSTTQLASNPPRVASRGPLTALQFDGKLYVFGGSNHKGCLNDMYDISLTSRVPVSDPLKLLLNVSQDFRSPGPPTLSHRATPTLGGC